MQCALDTVTQSLQVVQRRGRPHFCMWLAVAPNEYRSATPIAAGARHIRHTVPSIVVTASQGARQRPRWQAPSQRQGPAAAVPPPFASSHAVRGPPPANIAASDLAEGYEAEADDQTMEQRLMYVKNMIATCDLLVPYDRSAVNLGLILWGAIRGIPPKDRMQLVSLLSSGDIMKLWKVAGQRYRAPKQQVAAAIGPEYSLWKDMPGIISQISHFRGKAALPTHALGVSSFSKAFFLQPGSEQLYGRVLLGKGPLGDLLYPLYFQASVGSSVVPITQELCDMTLQYLPPGQLGLARDDLPRGLWPSPARQLPPFNEGFTDYLRAVAPGVYVGLGYRTAAMGKSDPLYFIMVHQRTEDLL